MAIIYKDTTTTKRPSSILDTILMGRKERLLRAEQGAYLEADAIQAEADKKMMTTVVFVVIAVAVAFIFIKKSKK